MYKYAYVPMVLVLLLVLLILSSFALVGNFPALFVSAWIIIMIMILMIIMPGYKELRLEMPLIGVVVSTVLIGIITAAVWTGLVFLIHLI